MPARVNIAPAIKKYVFQTFPVASQQTFDDDDSLLEKGIVDSMGILELVSFIERQFAITITDEDLSPENFRSINSLAQFVRSRVAIQA